MIRAISVTRQIAAAPPAIYSLIADYQDGHRRIVPPRAFKWLSVQKGGVGAGTEIKFAMRAFGVTRIARGVVSEPEPGRVLVETYPDSGDVTTFFVDAQKGSSSSNVTITTDLQIRSGLAGRIHEFLAERFLRPLYAEELQRIADQAEGRLRHEPVPNHPGA